MPWLMDVNCLLALCYQRHVHHPAALAWADRREVQSLALCRTTQMSLLRLLTNPAVMDADVCSLEHAWQVYDALLVDERFFFAVEPVDLEASLRAFTSTGRSSPKLWQDAYLAAFARSGGMKLASFDRGFRQFDGLALQLLAG